MGFLEQLPGPAGLAAAIGALALGLWLLVRMGDVLVSASVKAALGLKVPVFVIGLTIVAFGTSAPELFVAIEAALAGQDGVVFGNVIGSNVCNILLVLGLPALLYTLSSDVKGLGFGVAAMLISTSLFVLLYLLGTDISHADAGLLLLLLAVFLIVSSRQSGADEEISDLAEEDLPFGLHNTPLILGLMMVVAIAGLVLGAELTVSSAVVLAARIPGMSQEIVGLTIVALGTSLPELATTMAAARRGQFGLGFGNILGSSIFNIHAILGIAAFFSADGLAMARSEGDRIPLDADLVILYGATGLAAFYILGREPRIDRLSGLLLTGLYVAYIAFLILPLVA